MNTKDFNSTAVREEIRKIYNEYATSQNCKDTYGTLRSFDKEIEELIDQTGVSENRAYEDMYEWLIECGM